MNRYLKLKFKYILFKFNITINNFFFRLFVKNYLNEIYLKSCYSYFIFDIKKKQKNTIFSKNKSDKSGLWFSKRRNKKIFRHSYGEYYQELFRDKKIKNFLEIGLGNNSDKLKPGGSIKAFKTILPKTKFYGIDILDKKYFRNIDFKYFKVDQSKKEDLKNFFSMIKKKTKLDVIIDDGSHKTEDQILTFNNLIKVLSDKGIYFIEDIRNDQLKIFYDFFNKKKYKVSFINFFLNENTYGNILIRIEK